MVSCMLALGTGHLVVRSISCRVLAGYVALNLASLFTLTRTGLCRKRATMPAQTVPREPTRM